jgi:hypothetical protein
MQIPCQKFDSRHFYSKIKKTIEKQPVKSRKISCYRLVASAMVPIVFIEFSSLAADIAVTEQNQLHFRFIYLLELISRK